MLTVFRDWVRTAIARGARGTAGSNATQAQTQRRNRRGRMRNAWRRSRPGLAVVVLLTAFINCLKLTLPLYIFHVLDRVIASRSVDTLIVLTIITAFALLVAALADLTRRWMLAHWGNWIEQYFGRHMFAASIERAQARKPGRALDDLSELSQFASGGGLTTWLDAMWAPAFLLMVYLIHPALGWIVLAGMVGIIALGTLNEIVTRPMRAAARKARLEGESVVNAAAQKLESVASLNLGERLAERWHRATTDRHGEMLSSRMMGFSIGEAMRLTEVMQRLACYGVGVWLAIGENLTVGGIIAAAVIGRLGTSVVRRAMSNWRQLVVVRRAYDRVERRMGAIRERVTAIRDLDAELMLQVDQVTHTHNTWSRPQFIDLNFTVAPGEMVCIVGPSGAGKSTLAKLIAGVGKPTMGAVRFGGLDITRFTHVERQSVLGYLQQDASLFDGTIAENISSLREPDVRAVVEAARLAGIHDVIEHLPEGYETVISSLQTAFAGGEIRRLGLARALYGRPRLIVLDEPEANLDERLVVSLLETLQHCRDWGSAIVTTSQSDHLARIADKVIVLGSSGPVAQFSREEYVSWRHQGPQGTAQTAPPAPATPLAEIH